MASSRPKEHERITEQTLGSAGYSNLTIKQLERELALLPSSFGKPILDEINRLKVTPGELEKQTDRLDKQVRQYWLLQFEPLQKTLDELDVKYADFEYDLKSREAVKNLKLKIKTKIASLDHYRRIDISDENQQPLVEDLQNGIDNLASQVDLVKEEVEKNIETHLAKNELWRQKQLDTIKLAAKLIRIHPNLKDLKKISNHLKQLPDFAEELVNLRYQLNEIVRQDNEAELKKFAQEYAARRQLTPKSTSCWSLFFAPHVDDEETKTPSAARKKNL